MTNKDLEQYIYGNENIDVEFKQSKGDFKETAELLAIAISGMANREPEDSDSWGAVLLNVIDHKHRQGKSPPFHRPIDKSILKQGVRGMKAQIRQNLLIQPTIEEIQFKIDGIDVFALFVKVSEIPIGTQKGIYKIRRRKGREEPEAYPMDPGSFMRRQASAYNRDICNEILIQATTKDFNFDLIKEYLLQADSRLWDSIQGLEEEEILKTVCALLNINSDGHNYPLGALLLWGKSEALIKNVPNQKILIVDELVTGKNQNADIHSISGSDRDKVRYDIKTEERNTHLV